MPLTAWANFYVVVGSAAGALTGLTFVVISLLAQAQLGEAERGTAAYTTPTIAQFAAVLFVCVVLSAPWPALIPPAVLLGLCGLVGILYTALIVRRQRRLEAYTPVLEDLLSYGLGPFLAYAALLVAGILLTDDSNAAPFVVFGAVVLLLFLAIYSAWDLVTYITVHHILQENQQSEQTEHHEPHADAEE